MIGIAARWLLSRAQGLWRFVLAHPWQCAVIALLALSWQLWERGDRYRDRLLAVQTTQKEATAAQVAINHEPAARSAAIAEKSNAEAPAYYDSVRRAADAARVRPTACPVSRPDLPRADSVEPSVHGPDPAPDLVCRPAIEDTQLVSAAARAAEMHQEALDLIAEGVAVASDTTGR